MRYFIWKISFIIFLTSCSTIPEISSEKKEGLYFYRSTGLSSIYGYGYPITLELNGERFKLGVASSKNMKPVIGKNTLKKISTGFVGEFALNETPYHFEYRNGEYIEIGVSNSGPFEIQVKNVSNQTIELRHASEDKLMSNLPPCRGLINGWYDCFGTFGHDKAGKYVGEFKSGKFGGYGVYTTSDGKKYEGYFENGILIRERKTSQFDGSKINETASNENVVSSTKCNTV